MSLSHRNGIALSGISALNGISKATLAAINGQAIVSGSAATRLQQQIIETSPAASGQATLTNVQAGSLLVVRASVFNSIGIGTITVTSTIGGSGANTWTTHEDEQNAAFSASCHIASASNASAGTTVVTVTVNGSTGDRYITAVVEEWSGLTSSAFDVSTSANGVSTSVDTGTTAAKAQDHELVLCVVGVSNNDILSTPTGYATDYLRSNSGGLYQPIATGSKTVNAAGGESAAVTLAGSDAWAAAVATFRIA